MDKQNNINELIFLLKISLSPQKTLSVSKEEELMSMAIDMGWASDRAKTYVHSIMNLGEAVKNVIKNFINKN